MTDACELPHLEEIFDELRRGYHICFDDGAPYRALSNHFESYRRLFSALGFELVRHERDFFYFRSSGNLGKTASQMAVFFFILVEVFGDRGENLRDAIFKADHRIDKLPHFQRESHRACLSEVGIDTDDALGSVIKKLERYGFAERRGDTFRFRKPAWRFVELCFEASETNEEEQ